MVDTDDTRRTTYDGQRTTNNGRRTTPWVWHKLPIGELISKLNTNLKFKNGKSKFTVNMVHLYQFKTESITDFDTV